MNTTVTRLAAVGVLAGTLVMGATSTASASPRSLGTAAGIDDITGGWTRVVAPDDPPESDRLAVGADGSASISGPIYNCDGAVASTGATTYNFHLTCTNGGQVSTGDYPGSYDPAAQTLTITLWLRGDENFIR